MPQDGGPLGAALVDAVLDKLGVSLEEYQYFSAMSTVVSAMALMIVLHQIVRFYTPNPYPEHPLVKVAVGLGVVLALGLFVVSCFQLHGTIFQSSTHFIRWVYIDAKCLFTSLLVNTIFSVSCDIFYLYRIWKMSGQKIWVGIPCVGMVFTAIALAMRAIIQGYRLPPITIANAMEITQASIAMQEQALVYSIFFFADNLLITVASIYLLMRTKNRILPPSSHSGIFIRAAALLLESMTPVTIVYAILVIYIEVARGKFTLVDFNRLCTCVLPYLHFSSLLFSLLSRRTIRGLLDADPISQYRHDTSQRSHSTWKAGKESHSDFIALQEGRGAAHASNSSLSRAESGASSGAKGC